MPRLPQRLVHGQEAGLVDHLGELRSRIFIAGGAVVIASVAAWLVHGRILRLLIDALPAHHRTLLTLGVAEPFTTSLKLSIAAGFLLALPIVLWQVWAFFAPALNPQTQRSIAGFVVFAGALMIGGTVFGDRCAARCAEVPHQLRQLDLQRPNPRGGLHLLRSPRPRCMRCRLRVADRRPRPRSRQSALLEEAAQQPQDRLPDRLHHRRRAPRRRPGHDDHRDDPAGDPLRSLDLAVCLLRTPLGNQVRLDVRTASL